MKAVVQERYGSIDDLLVRDVDEPDVGDDDVLIRVRAASVHPDVWHVVTGRPYVLRLMGAGVLRPKNPIPGSDVAGIVERVGKAVTRFRQGDEVFGETTVSHGWATGGAYAEYVSVRQDQLALKPRNVTFEQAGSVPTSGFIALLNLRGANSATPREEGVGERRGGWRWHDCPPGGEGLWRARHRRGQRAEARAASFARRRPGHRLHHGGFHARRNSLRPDLRRTREPPVRRLQTGLGTRREIRSHWARTFWSVGEPNIRNLAPLLQAGAPLALREAVARTGIAAQLSPAEQQLVSLQTMLQAQRLDRAELVTTGWTQLLEARRKARAAASWSIAD